MALNNKSFVAKSLLCLAVIVCVSVMTDWASACNIPVFRYALERWKPDACEVFVFTDAGFKADQHAELAQLTKAAQDKRSNLSVSFSEVGVDKDPRHRELWETIRQLPGAKLPYVVVRTSVNDKQAVNGWHGPLANFQASQLLESPSRRELAKRLLKGDSVVWIVLKSNHTDRNEQIVQLSKASSSNWPRTHPFLKAWACRVQSFF